MTNTSSEDFELEKFRLNVFCRPLIITSMIFKIRGELVVICIFSQVISAIDVYASHKSSNLRSPNFILLMGDDHGWSETGYNGHPHVQTPVLDEMARTGLRFNAFYAAHPTCSPTRGSFLTGRHPNRYGTFSPGWSIRPEEITIAHLLSEAGYRCGHFGKWHIGPVKLESPTNPASMGFHHYVSHDNFFEMNPAFSRDGRPPEIIKGEGSEVTIDETIKFIETAREADQPFFAVVWYGSPHEPYSGLQKDLKLYDDLPEEYAQRKVRLTSLKTGRPTERPLRDVLRERYAEITAMDRSIGKLRDYLESKELRKNTILFYCGDNGNPRSSGRTATPLRAEKGFVYEGGIRVPGVMEWPAKIARPRTTDVAAVTSDLLPTLCDIAEIDLPKRPLDGISLLSLIDGDMSERTSPIFFWKYNTQLIGAGASKPKPWINPSLQQGTTPLVKYSGQKLTRDFKNFHIHVPTAADYMGSCAVIGNQYKLVIDGSTNRQIELFDIQNDQAEKINISQQNTEIVSKMRGALRTWKESVLQSLQGKDY